jgi:hypothetical protein
MSQALFLGVGDPSKGALAENRGAWWHRILSRLGFRLDTVSEAHAPVNFMYETL